MFKKALILSIVTIAISTLLVPFSLKADYYNTAPFVGINYYIEDYDNENKVTFNSGNTSISLSGSQTNTLLVQRTSNGVTYVTSTYSQGGVSGNGGNISLSGNINLGSSLTNTQVVYRVIRFEIVLDSNYIGYVRPRVTKSGNSTNLFQQDLAVNGNKVEFTIVDSDLSTSADYSVTWSDFTLYHNNTNERWAFPIESFGLAQRLFEKFDTIGINKYNTYYMPIFDIKNNDVFLSEWINNNHFLNVYFILDKSVWSIGSLQSYISMTSGLDYELQRYFSVNTSYTGVNVRITNNTGYSKQVNFTALSNLKIIPVIMYWDNYLQTSTDFALNFGLPNVLLHNLEIIANGNSTSNNSSSSADQMNQQAQSTFTQEEQLVNNAENDLQSNLQSLDIQNQNNNLFGNSKFIASASWVKTQFDTLTNNNAFGYLITFSLVIGLSLVIVGKLRS